jgi:hypothetical protein
MRRGFRGKMVRYLWYCMYRYSIVEFTDKNIRIRTLALWFLLECGLLDSGLPKSFLMRTLKSLAFRDEL